MPGAKLFNQQWRLQMQFVPSFNLFLLTVEPDGFYFLTFLQTGDPK